MSDDDTPSAPPRTEHDRGATPPPPRRRRRRWWIALTVALLLLAGGIVLGPALVSTGPGRSLALGVANSTLPGSLNVGSWSLSWFGGQRVEGLTLRDPAGRQVLAIERITTGLTLWSALRGHLDTGRSEVTGLRGDLVVDEKGRSNLDRALGIGGSKKQDEGAAGADGPTAPEDTPALPPSLRVDAELTDARLTLSGPGAPEVTLSELSAVLKLAPGEPVVARLLGEAEQAGQSGRFRISAEAQRLVGPAGRLAPAEADLDVEADATGVPADVIDRLAGLGGVARAALGPRFDVQARATGPVGEQQVTAELTAPRSRVNLAARITAAGFALTEPATAQITATPALTEALATRFHPAIWQLTDAAELKLTVEKFAAPLTGFAPEQTAIRAAIAAQQPLQLRDEALGKLTVRDASASMRSEKLTERIEVNATAKLDHGDRPANLTVEATARNAFDASGRFQRKTLRLAGSIEADGLPVALADRVAGTERPSATLGDRLSVSARAQSDEPGRFTINANAESPKLRLEKLALAVDEELALTGPATVRYQASPADLRGLLGRELPYPLQKPVEVKASIDELRAPMPTGHGPAFQPGQTSLQATVTCEPIHLAGVPRFGELIFKRFNATLNAQPLTSIKLTANVDAAEPEPGLLAEITGGSALNIGAELATGLDKDRALQPLQTTLTLGSERLAATLPLCLESDFQRVNLAEAGTVDLTVAPALLRRLGATRDAQPLLAEPWNARLTLDTAEMRAPWSPAHWELAGKLDARPVRLAVEPGASLDRTTGAFRFRGADGAAEASLESKVQWPDANREPSELTVKAEAERLLRDGAFRLTDAAVDARAQVQRMPTGIAGALLGHPVRLPVAIGPMVAVNADLRLPAGETGTVDLRAEADRLTADAGLRLLAGEGGLLGRWVGFEQTRPTKLKWTAHPDSAAMLYASLQGSRSEAAASSASEEDAEPTKPNNRLDGPVTLTANMPALRLATRRNEQGKLRIDAAGSALKAAVELSTLKLRKADTDRTLTVDGLALTVDATELTESAAVSLRAPTIADPAGRGRLELTGRITDPAAFLRSPEPANLSAKLNVKAETIPGPLADAWLGGGNGALAETLGEQGTLAASADLQKLAGPVSLKVESGNLTTSLSGRMQPDGHLTLTEDATLALRVTENMSRALRDKYIRHPLLKQAIDSLKPITVNVESDGFRLPVPPVRPFDLAAVRLRRATLDLGKMRVRNAGLINQLTSLPKTVGSLADLDLSEVGNRLGKDELVAWFTPVDLSVDNGIARYSRVDMLLGEDYQVATWGVLNLRPEGAEPFVTDSGHELPPRHGRMILGIAERALRNVYGVTQFREESNYVDQFVMQGPIDSLSPDVKEMSARLGALTALGAVGQAAGEKIGNVGFGILQDLGRLRDAIDQARGQGGQVKKRQFETPPEPRKPFPWPEEEKQPSQQQEQGESQQQDKQTEQQDQRDTESRVKDALRDLFK